MVGASVPGDEGEGTSIGGCDGGLSAGATLGWAGSEGDVGWAGWSGVDGGVWSGSWSCMVIIRNSFSNKRLDAANGCPGLPRARSLL